jgi:multiple sugar transport system permease protein
MDRFRVVKNLKEAAWFAPAGTLVGLIFVWPIMRTVGLSLSHLSLATGFGWHFAGLANFRRLIVDSRFHNSLWITIEFSFISVVLEFFLGLLLALAVDHLGRGRRSARTLLLIPWTLPTAVVAILWTWIFNDQYGIVNALLLKAGIIHSPIAWLAQPGTAMTSIIAADVWKAFPFVLILMLAGLQSIPKDIYEAMEIDGGNAWHKLWYVTLPYLRPFIFLALIFRMVQAFAVFDLVYVATGGGPGGATETVSVYSYHTFMRYLDIGYGAALAVATVLMLALIAWALYALLLRHHEMGR